MTSKERLYAVKVLVLLAAATFLLWMLSGCAWTPTSRYFCPHFIPQSEYDRLRGLSVVTVLPAKPYTEVCGHNTMGCINTWMKDGAVIGANIWLPENLPELYHEATIAHEICHAYETDRGLAVVGDNSHKGWHEAERLKPLPPARVMAALP